MISVQKILVCLSFFMIIGNQLAYANNESQNNYVPPTVITPDALTWGTFDAFPPGAKAAILSGDPRKPGPFMLRIKIPAHYKVPPNWQTVTIYATVLSGSYTIGVGDKFEPKNGKRLPSTGSVVIPANTHLYFWSNEGATLEVYGIGPWEIHYVDPADDPRQNQR